MLQRVQKNTPPHFVTKRVADPNMIPMLVAAGVEFGAVKVCPAAHLKAAARFASLPRCHYMLRESMMSGMKNVRTLLQATMTGALARVVGTTLALWLPLVPLYLFVRHAISSRSP